MLKFIEMKPMLSQDYQSFHKHVFGDYRYFHYGALPEEICTRLEGTEREKAEKLVLRAIKKHRKDERPIIAAGYLRTEAAIPLLEAILSKPNDNSHPQIRIYSAWAFFKINGDKKYLKILTDAADNSAISNTGVRDLALALLSDFGKEAAVVDVLLHALLDTQPFVSPTAHSALLKIFQDDFMMCQLLKDRNYAISSNGWSNIVQEARLRLGS